MRALFVAVIVSGSCVSLFAQDAGFTGAMSLNAAGFNNTTFIPVESPSTSLPSSDWVSPRQDLWTASENRTVMFFPVDNGESLDFSSVLLLLESEMPQPFPVPLTGTYTLPSLDGSSQLQPVPLVVPEPSSMSLGALACGFAVFAGVFRTRKPAGF